MSAKTKGMIPLCADSAIDVTSSVVDSCQSIQYCLFFQIFGSSRLYMYVRLHNTNM